MKKFIPLTIIEDKAQNLIQDYLRKTGNPFSLPIPVWDIAETVLDLNILYDCISGGKGQMVLGGLIPSERTIIINEKYIDQFEEKPGRELFTCAHEIGHWVIHVDVKQSNPQLCLDLTGKDGRIMCRDGDSSFIELQADCFAGALVMPKSDLIKSLERKSISWPLLYELREQFGVTISALVRRINTLGIAYIGKDKKVFKSKQEAQGQISLF